MSAALLSVRGLVKRFGGLVATQNVDFDVLPGQIHSLIGPNGAGKTTLLAQIAGLLKPDEGTITFDGADITRLPVPQRALRGLGRTFQITSIFPEFTVFENVLVAAQAQAGHCFRFWAPVRRDRELGGRVQATLDHLALGRLRDVVAGNLAHGEKRVLEIAIALATRPRILLLDEPTAGMGTQESEAIKALLNELRRDYAMVLIEHDMDAVFRLSDQITVLAGGQVIASGSPERIRGDENVRRAYLGEDDWA